MYELKLMRLNVDLKYMKIPEKKDPPIEIPPTEFDKPSPIGCNLKLEFALTKELWCKVYRRVRWEDLDKKNRKYKDWKVKVLINDRRDIFDYLVVYKLPCRLSEMKQKLRANLKVEMNNKVIPPAIQYLVWERAYNGVHVMSQTFFDYKGFDIKENNWIDRFDYIGDCCYYIQQNVEINLQKPD